MNRKSVSNSIIYLCNKHLGCFLRYKLMPEKPSEKSSNTLLPEIKKTQSTANQVIDKKKRKRPVMIISSGGGGETRTRVQTLSP